MEIPEGYAVNCFRDYRTLHAPDGVFIGYYDLDVPAEEIVEAARTHKALNTTCQWDPGCSVCEERRRRALVA